MHGNEELDRVRGQEVAYDHVELGMGPEHTAVAVHYDGAGADAVGGAQQALQDLVFGVLEIRPGVGDRKAFRHAHVAFFLTDLSHTVIIDQRVLLQSAGSRRVGCRAWGRASVAASVTIDRSDVVARIAALAARLTGGDKTALVSLALPRLERDGGRSGSLFGVLPGSLVVCEGVDLTAPVLEDRMEAERHLAP